MKRLIFPFAIAIGLFVLWAPINAFHNGDLFELTTVSSEEPSLGYSVKYKDCIPQDSFSSQNKEVYANNIDYRKVNIALKKYEQSISATLKNLNAIEAHGFLHQEFQRSKDAVLSQGLSELKLYYHQEIMRICFEKDRLLNVGPSQTHL